MFNNSFLSDVTIRLIVKEESKTYYGHKAILCAHSEFFMKAFNGNFNVYAFTEKDAGSKNASLTFTTGSHRGYHQSSRR
jgi:hypothetical protein